jgi:hypothetical protein
VHPVPCLDGSVPSYLDSEGVHGCGAYGAELTPVPDPGQTP